MKDLRRISLWRLTLALKRKPYILQVFLFLFLSYLIVFTVLPFIGLADVLFGENSNGPDLGATFGSWVEVAVFAPILETFLLQWLPFKILQRFSATRRRYGMYMMVSAAIFGILHWYSIQYILFAYVLGLLFAYIFVFYCKQGKRAFWTVTLVHGLRNTLAFFVVLAS